MRPETLSNALVLQTAEVSAGPRMKVLHDVANTATEMKAEKGRAKDNETWNSRL